jgi:hypothetical protein
MDSAVSYAKKNGNTTCVDHQLYLLVYTGI